MSNSEWHNDQSAGHRAMAEWDRQKEADEGQRALADELREVLSEFLDAMTLKGHVLRGETWRRACFLCGRWTPPFIDPPLTEKSYNERSNPYAKR